MRVTYVELAPGLFSKRVVHGEFGEPEVSRLPWLLAFEQ
jgi:hypothetical protein